MVPQYIIVKGLGLYNTHTSLILIQAFSAFGVFLLRQNMLSIPDSLHEAAKIDGCGAFRTYWNIILPLTKTGLATLTVLTFNAVWNDYMGPMLYLDSDSLRTIQVALASFKSQYSADYASIMAGNCLLPDPHRDRICLCAEVYRRGRCLRGRKGIKSEKCSQTTGLRHSPEPAPLTKKGLRIHNPKPLFSAFPIFCENPG